MKFVLCLAALIAVAIAEPCTNLSDCDHITCSGADWDMACVTSQCTCLHSVSTGTCTMKSDCTNTCANALHGMHCVNGQCKCGHGDHGNHGNNNHNGN